MNLKDALLVTEEQLQERKATCEGCEYFKTNTRSCGTLIIGGKGVHSKTGKKIRLCGCYIDAKARLKITDCPAGSWKRLFDLTNANQWIRRAKELIEQVETRNDNSWTREEIREAFTIERENFGTKTKDSNCVECIQKAFKNLRKMITLWEHEQKQLIADKKAARKDNKPQPDKTIAERKVHKINLPAQEKPSTEPPATIIISSKSKQDKE